MGFAQIMFQGAVSLSIDRNRLASFSHVLLAIAELWDALIVAIAQFLPYNFLVVYNVRG